VTPRQDLYEPKADLTALWTRFENVVNEDARRKANSPKVSAPFAADGEPPKYSANAVSIFSVMYKDLNAWFHSTPISPCEYGVGREFRAVVADDHLTCGCR
jgi:hypothetical protein